ncbi:hypothetical protein QYM36_005711 [Artemia franciscana]|nr:hypothetical protein QYM36_005711 [Artemia franciscana]
MLLTDISSGWNTSIPASGPNLQIATSLPPPSSIGIELNNGEDMQVAPYSCPFCDKNFARQSLLKKHEQTHSDQLPFKCEYCQRLFKHKRSRDRHVKLHTGDRKYKCEQCEAAFSRSDHLKIHIKTHDSRKPFQCSLCQRGYNTGAALTSHMLNHRRESSSVSSTSSVAMSQVSSRISHSPVTESSPATPPESPLEDDSKKEMESRLQSSNDNQETINEKVEVLIKVERTSPVNSAHDGADHPSLPASPQSLRCQYCGLNGFSSLEALGNHVQSLHGPSCSTVSQTSSPGSNSAKSKAENRAEQAASPRQMDMTPSYVQRLLFCSLCSARFTSPITLQQHIFSSHNAVDALRLYYPSFVRYPALNGIPSEITKDSLGEPQLTCPQCPLSFCDVESYSIHLKSHWETALRMTQGLYPQRIACTECGLDMAGFSSSQADAHAASHILTTSVEYGCQACVKTFAKPDELQKHLLDIHAHHLFKCSLCEEVFDSKVAIQVHFAVKHSDECKVYRCTVCPVICKSETEFTLHVKTSHSPMPSFRCTICAETFSVEFLLERHIQTEHGIHPGYGYQAQFKCETCHEQFTSTAMLLLHIQSTHSEIRPCSVCGEVFRSYSELENHIKLHHAMNNSTTRIKCNICDDYFGSPFELAEHKLKHYKNQGQPQCSSCKAVITNRDDFKRHTNLHVGEMPFLCIICRQNIGSVPELELHMQFHIQSESKPVSCTHCSSKFSTEQELREHSFSHLLVGKTPECMLCKQSFENVVQLQLHLIEHSHVDSASYPCSVCSAVFTQGMSLQRHTIEHDLSSRPYTCNDCGLKFFFSSELEHHATSHKQKSPREFRCEECYQCFPSLSMLSHHRLIHDNVSSPVKCPECSATFSEGSTMIMHFKNVHEALAKEPESKEFKCEHCGMDFPCLSNLQGHVKLHKSDTCFRCDVCSKLFGEQRNLQTHMRIHSGERPYGCRMCDKRFARKENRKAHEKSHTGIKPFTCSVCLRAFTRKCHLREHKKLHERTSQSPEEMNISTDDSDEEVNVDDV